VHPSRHGNQALAREYSDILLRARNVTTFPVSPEIAVEAARLLCNARGKRLVLEIRDAQPQGLRTNVP
jgi:hypothetical protein